MIDGEANEAAVPSTTSSRSAEPARPSVGWLGAATVLGPLAVSIHVPVLPAIGRALTGQADGAGSTVSAFLWVFAASMLVVGPASDRWGRRPVLLFGLATYALGSVLAASAPTLALLVAARALQALGAAALIIVPRAMIRDGFEQTTTPMSQLATLQSMAPAVAPLVGGMLGSHLGWRATFAALVVGAGLVALGSRHLVETRPPRATRRVVRPSSWSRLTFSALIGAMASAIYFSLLPVAPQVLAVFGEGPRRVGTVLLFVAAGFAGGAALAPHLVRLRGRPFGMALGSLVLLAGVLLALGVPTMAGIGIGLVLYALASGALLPLAIAEGLDAVPAHAGRAASILGAVQLGAGAAASSLVAGGVPFAVVAAPAAVGTAVSACLALTVKVSRPSA